MTPDRIVRNYLAIILVYNLSASLIWGVNTLFLLDAGLDIFEVFVANAAFTAGMVAFEIPTGILADTVGRRASFLWSVALLGASTVLYLILAAAGAGVIPFVAASVLIGLGFTFYSGAVEAWLVDALAAAGYDGALDDVFSRGGVAMGTAMLVGTVGGGFLGDVDLAFPYVVRVLLLILLFGLAWFGMHDVGFEPRTLQIRRIPVEMRRVARDSLQYGWRIRPVQLFMVVSLIQGSFMVWAWYAWQPYLLGLLERDAVWVAGLVAALLSGAMVAGSRLARLLMQRARRRTTILIAAAATQTAGGIAVGITDSFVIAVAGLLLWAAGTALYRPIKQGYVHQLIPSGQRATVISLDSMMESAGGVGGQLGLGYLARTQSIEAGYIAGGTAIALAIPVLVVLRGRDDAADHTRQLIGSLARIIT